MATNPKPPWWVFRRARQASAPTVHTTYAIRDPRSGLFVYVGQTSDFGRRCRAHLACAKVRPKRRSVDVKVWLFELAAAGLAPGFQVLEVVRTREASLASEAKWVDHLAESGHPLLNRWKSHKAIIRRCKPPVSSKSRRASSPCQPSAAGRRSGS